GQEGARVWICSHIADAMTCKSRQSAEPGEKHKFLPKSGANVFGYFGIYAGLRERIGKFLRPERAAAIEFTEPNDAEWAYLFDKSRLGNRGGDLRNAPHDVIGPQHR